MNQSIVVDEIVIPITVDYLEEDRIYQVSCPWLQGCHAWGETLDEAMRAIPGNIRAMIEARRVNNSPLPSELERVKWNPALDRYTTIPDWGSRDIRPGTLRRIIRDLGISRREFGPIK